MGRTNFGLRFGMHGSDLRVLSKRCVIPMVGALSLQWIVACNLDFDKDGDGYFNAPEAEGTLLYDCYPEEAGLHLGLPSWRDGDLDMLGDANSVCYICIAPGEPTPASSEIVAEPPCGDGEQYVFNAFDCDDEDANLREGRFYYRDADGDGLGDPNPSLHIYACVQGPDDSPPFGYVSNAEDCNDEFASTELKVSRYYLDADNDTFGGAIYYESCSAEISQGYVSNTLDCDDNDITVSPSVQFDCLEDRADARDNDCDGLIDEDEGKTWYPDADGDGFGRSGEGRKDCIPLPGYVSQPGDCNDNDPGVYPGTEECPIGA